MHPLVLLVAQMASSTFTQQQQLESLQAKAAEGARLLAEARAAGRETQQALQEQQRLSKQQAATLEEMKQELAAARKASLTAGKCQEMGVGPTGNLAGSARGVQPSPSLSFT
jgi:septal ring factor EnvC (AmiA/AmiB activator)